MKVNDMLHGFRLIRQSEIKEISAETFLFEHEKSGARLFYVKNEDDNKVFHITFRTPPKDDTGVAHIVEHSTLCGSRKYPLKEPFVELVKGSLNTFLNAMTYPDKTMYPVASRNDKDFQNLMDVYLDAVFYPAMRENPQVLMQEGWHYEIDNPEAPLQYSGVVYNEMKGALSDPDDLLTDKITQALYPDTTYHYESGGDPAAIPQLTQEKFIAFHSRFYHPSNSYIYLYGDMDIEEKLAYLDREYLSHFDRIEVDSEIAAQQPFTEMKRVQTEYPIGADEDTKDKTYLSLVWSVPSIDAETALGVDVLMNALLTREASPLRQALLDAHLGKDVDTASEAELRQPFLGVTVNGSEPERAEKFYGIVMDCLKKYAEEGLERTLLEASLNSTEFHLREADFGSTPKGLIYGIQIMKSWLYDGEPEEYLRYEAALKTLRDGLKTHYYEDLIRRILIDNPYCVLLTMQPSRTLAAEKEKRTAEELAARKAEMTPADIENIIADVKALKERQRLAVGVVVVQAIGADVRALLHHVVAQGLPERGVQQVGRGVVGCDVASDLRVDAGGHLHALGELAELDASDVDDRLAHALGVLDDELGVLAALDGAMVADLAAHLAVERGGVEDQHGLLVGGDRVDLGAVLVDPGDGGVGLQGVVAGELRHLGHLDVLVVVDVEARVLLGVGALLGHLGIEAVHVKRVAAVADHVGGEVGREAVGVVELEHHVARDDLGGAELVKLALEQEQSAVEGL